MTVTLGISLTFKFLDGAGEITVTVTPGQESRGGVTNSLGKSSGSSSHG